MIPFYTALVPLVKLMTDIHMTNSLLGMIIYYCGRNMPMAVFLYVGFIRGVSGEILEAGKIDGASVWTLYWRVLFPILKPITTTIIAVSYTHLDVYKRQIKDWMHQSYLPIMIPIGL